MKKWLGSALLSALAIATVSCDNAGGNNSESDATPAAAADPNPAMQDPDQVAWQLFLTVVSPPDGGSGTTFETWASDAETFSQNPPPFPTERKAIQPRRARPTQQMGLGKAHAFAAAAPAPVAADATKGGAEDDALQPATLHSLALEEVRRNQPSYDYIVQNGLNVVSGLKKAYGKTITFPKDSIEVKTNWLTIAQVQQYYPSRVTADIPANFLVVPDQNQVQWVLVSMHVISKQVPNWTWATFEHNANPGRCDIIGCYDSFGAQQAAVVPAATPEGDYGPCAQTQALADMMQNLQVFTNYCLKGSQTDFTDPTGLVIRLGNSIIEGGFVQTSSCMTCHATAGWDQNGQSTTDSAPIGAVPSGIFWSNSQPLQNGQNQQVATAADFVWSIPFCAFDDVNGGGAQCTGPR